MSDASREIASDAFVVLQPHSSTNGSDQFRVVKYGTWQLFVNGEGASYPFMAFASYAEASEVADVANHGSQEDVLNLLTPLGFNVSLGIEGER
jgi:hypothetical protein